MRDFWFEPYQYSCSFYKLYKFLKWSIVFCFTDLTGLIIVFLLSTTGTIALWMTDAMNEILYTVSIIWNGHKKMFSTKLNFLVIIHYVLFQQMVIENNTRSFDMWRHVPAKPKYKVYIFNYTNAERYQNGLDTKLKVQELGPYVYE